VVLLLVVLIKKQSIPDESECNNESIKKTFYSLHNETKMNAMHLALMALMAMASASEF